MQHLAKIMSPHNSAAQNSKKAPQVSKLRFTISTRFRVMGLLFYLSCVRPFAVKIPLTRKKLSQHFCKLRGARDSKKATIIWSLAVFLCMFFLPQRTQSARQKNTITHKSAH